MNVRDTPNTEETHKKTHATHKNRERPNPVKNSCIKRDTQKDTCDAQKQEQTECNQDQLHHKRQVYRNKTHATHKKPNPIKTGCMKDVTCINIMTASTT